MPALHVPDHAALILILRTGLIPIDVQQEAVRFVRADDGVIIDARIDQATRAKLTRAGFKLERRWTFGAGERASCWAEIVPGEIAQEPQPPLGELLFIVEAERAIGLCSELLRLGGDQQSFCFFKDQNDTQMAAIRAIEPPYYLVLKGLDGEARVYQGAGRVRVAVGYRHCLSDQVAAPAGALLLIGADKWQTVPDGPWIDLHQVIDVIVRPNQPLPVIKAPIRIPVRLRLVRAPKLGSPQGWVLTQQARPQLEALVRTLPDSVIERLRFVAAGPPDDPTIVLRTRQGRETPPQLELDGIAYVPAPGIPNLWLPWGQGIDPPIRAGRQAALLAADSQNLYWATPLEAVRHADFRMHSVTESAFAPLRDFIEYLATAEAAITPWIRSAVFDFASFTVADPAGRAARSDSKKELKSERPTRSVPKPKRRPKEQSIAPSTPQIVLPDLPKAPEQVIQAITILEREFCTLDSPLSDPERGPLWAQLAHLEANAGRSVEAAICRAQAIWALPSESSAPLVKSWAQTLRGQTESLFKLLKHDSPSRLEIQSIGMQILALPSLSGDKLSAVQTWMGRFEARLDLRTRWLVRQVLCGWSGGDRLGLLRTRDGMIQAMHNGLPVAANVPAFIRAFRGGIKGQLNILQDALGDLWTQYQQTARSRHALEAKAELTDAYVALTFAWAHAQFGDAVTAQQLSVFAADQLPKNDPVHTVLQQTYALRISEAADAQPMGGSLPQSLLAARHALPALDGFKVNRLWVGSSILDSSMGRDAFKTFGANRGAGQSPFELLRLESDLDRVAREFDTIFAQGPPTEDESASEWWQQAVDVVDGLPKFLGVPRLRRIHTAVNRANPSLKSQILSMIIRLAGAIDQTTLIEQTLTELAQLVEQVPDSDLSSLTEQVARISADCQRAGLSNEVLALLSKIEGRLDQSAGMALLELLTTRSALGEVVDLSAARDAVIAHIGSQREPRIKQRLTRQLAFAIGRTSAEQAIATIARLMPQLKKTTDMMSTSSHFCFSVIHFMESMVLMLTSDQLWLDPWARRWVEADEHLIRHRIHDDLSGANE